MKTIKLFLTVFVVFFLQLTHAQTINMIMYTGASGGTYETMGKELSQVCKNYGLNISVKTSEGSADNIDALLTNKANIVLAQNDAAFVLGKDTPKANSIKSLLPLHYEEIHILGLQNYKKEGTTLGFGGTAPVLNDTSDLNKRKVAAYGGSVITAEIINDKAGMGMDVVEVADFQEAIKLLNDQKVFAVLIVGGSRIKNIEKLDGGFYKLAAFSQDHMKALNGSFFPTAISYKNLKQNNVKVMAVQATIFTRDYTSGNMHAGLVSLKKCLINEIENLAQTSGFHAKWSDIVLPGKEGHVPSRWPAWVEKQQPAAKK